MITNRYNGHLLGSPNIEISVAGQEILPSDAKRVINFSILNTDECHININNSGWVFFRAGQGLLNMPVVTSIKIQEAGIEFNWIGVKG